MIKIEVRSTLAAIRAQQVLTVGLVGVPVEFVFGEEWKNLAKTAVFRQEGGESLDVLLTDDRAVLPWAALLQPGLPVKIGVYGVNANGDVVIPTVWATTEPVRPGADPQLDPSLEPALPVWQQLQGIIGSMDNLQTDHKQTLVGAINEANRPVRRFNVYGNSDGSYYITEGLNVIYQEWLAGKQVVCSIDGLILQLVSVGDYIAEFAGIKDRRKYRVCIGGTEGVRVEKTDLAYRTDKLPNPNKLTLTGAVQAEYDGSEAVTVEFPTGICLVKLNYNGSEYLPNKTPEQLREAYMKGEQLLCDWNSTIMQLLTRVDERISVFHFGCVKNGQAYYAILSNGVAQVTVTNLATDQSKLPNPNKLTFTGAVEAEYDGSEAVSVEIPAGSSGVHIGSEEPEDEDVSLWIDPEQGEASDFISCPEQADVGQVLTVKTVDADGKPMEWECTQPNDPLYVAVTENGEGGYVSDMYFPEIKEAFDQERSVYCKLGGSVYHLDSVSSRFAIFVSHGAGNYSQLRIGNDASTIILTSTTFIPKPSSAKDGQILQYVVPSSGMAGWVAADLPEGGGNAEWKLVSEVTSTEAVSVVSATADDGLNDLLAYVLIPKIETNTGGTIYLDLVLQKNDGTTDTSLVSLPNKPTTDNTRYIIRADALGVGDVQIWSGSGATGATKSSTSEERNLKVRDVFVNGGKLLGIRVSWNLNNTLPSGTHVQLWGR